MSTFVVRFVGERAESFRGKVRHVASGEELVFTDRRGLLDFIERMIVVRPRSLAGEALTEMHRARESADKALPRPPRSAGRPPERAGGARTQNPARRSR